MSQHANPERAFVWIDGDAYRFPAGASMPEDPFAVTHSEGLAFGGIQAGFEHNLEQTVRKHDVWNYRQATYAVSRDPLNEGFAFRAVDNTAATALTRAQGGTITKVGDRFQLESGDGEEFGLLIVLSDGVDQEAHWSPRVTLDGPPTRTAVNGQDIDGWQFPITALAPFIEIMAGAPAGLDLDTEG